MKVLIIIGKGKINYFNTALNSSICFSCLCQEMMEPYLY